MLLRTLTCLLIVFVLFILIFTMTFEFILPPVRLKVVHTTGSFPYTGDGPFLMVLQHDLGHNDVHVAIDMLKKYPFLKNKKFFTVTSSRYLKTSFIRWASGLDIDVYSVRRKGTVDLIRSKLREGINCIVFTTRDSYRKGRSGIYHIQKDTPNLPIIAVNIATLSSTEYVKFPKKMCLYYTNIFTRIRVFEPPPIDTELDEEKRKKNFMNKLNEYIHEPFPQSSTSSCTHASHRKHMTRE